MGFTIEELNDAPVIVITVNPPVDDKSGPTQIGDAALAFQKEKNGQVVRIIDLTEVKFSFGDVAQGMATDVAFLDPNIKTIIVGTDALVKMAGEAFKQDQYGKVDVPVFASMDEAVEAARQALK